MRKPRGGVRIKPAEREYSTGEVAALCGISQLTVIRCIDRGTLVGHRIPGSKFRRVCKDDLLRFMDAWGIPRPPGGLATGTAPAPDVRQETKPKAAGRK